MSNTQNTFNAELGYAMRMVMTGQATPEQAAAACGVSLADIHAMLARCPQLRLQEVEHSRAPSDGAAASRYLSASNSASCPRARRTHS